MAKKTLDFDIEDHIDFELIGIICAHKDFRLCYEINNLLGIELRKTNDLEIKLEKKGSSGTFSLYQYINADDEQIYLVANKGNHTLFIPEQKHIDYFIMIRNRSPFTKIPELITKLKTINLINSVLPIEAVKLKSAVHFLYIEPEESNWSGSWQ